PAVQVAVAVSSPLLAVLLVAGLAVLWRRDRERLARLAIPLAVLVVAVEIAAEDVTPTAIPLLLAVSITPVALAYRAGGRRAWNLLAAYAAGGVLLGYGMLLRLLCEQARASCSSGTGTASAIAG